MPILLVTTCIFLAFEMMMWPLVYIKMVFHKLTMTWVYSRTYRSSRADKFMSFIIFFFFGPFIVMGNSVVDLWYFLRHMVRFDLQKIKHKTRLNLISKKNMDLVYNILNVNQEKLLNFKHVSSKVRQDMHIENLIIDALFPTVNWSLDPTLVDVSSQNFSLN